MLLKKSVAVASLSVASSGVSFIAQVLIANAFGAGGTLDAYLVASSAPVVATGLATSVLSYSMIPELVALNKDPAAFAKFARAALAIVACIAVVITGLGTFFSGWLAHLSRPLAPELQADARRLSVLCWIWTDVLLIGTFLGCVLTAMEDVFPSVALTALPPLGTAIAIMSLPERFGIYAIPFGALAGAALGASGMLLRAAPLLRGTAEGPSPWSRIRGYLAGVPWVAVAVLCFTIYPVIDAYWAPRMGVGYLSSLGYAHRLIIAAGAVILVGPSSLLVAHMARFGTEDEMRRRLVDVTKASIAVAAAFASVLSALSGSIIKVLFERGSFTAHATLATASIFPAMLVGMVGMVGAVVVFRGLYQLQLARKTAALGILWTATYALGSGGFGSIWSLQGIAVSYALAWWFVLVVAVRWASPTGADFANAWLPFLLVCVLAGLLGGEVSAAACTVASAGIVGVAVAGILGLGAYALAYWALCRFSPFKGARVWVPSPA